MRAVAEQARTDAEQIAGLAALVDALHPVYRAQSRGHLLHDARVIAGAFDRRDLREQARRTVAGLAKVGPTTAREAVAAWNAAIERERAAVVRPSERCAWRAAAARRQIGDRS